MLSTVVAEGDEEAGGGGHRHSSPSHRQSEERKPGMPVIKNGLRLPLGANTRLTDESRFVRRPYRDIRARADLAA